MLNVILILRCHSWFSNQRNHFVYFHSFGCASSHPIYEILNVMHHMSFESNSNWWWSTSFYFILIICAGPTIASQVRLDLEETCIHRISHYLRMYRLRALDIFGASPNSQIAMMLFQQQQSFVCLFFFSGK